MKNTTFMKDTPRGMLIALEGIDGSGKSTISRFLHQELSKQHSVMLTKEPGGTALGSHIRAIVQDKDIHREALAELLLFAADRAQHVAEIIKPALQAGIIVITDRFADSSVAYQGFGRGLDIGMINTINVLALQGIRPDIILYTKVDAELAYLRCRQRSEALTAFEQEKKVFFNRVIEGFETLFAQQKNVVTIDASLPIEQVCQHALNAVLTRTHA